jgi:menaquinol-cytochrome c reductase iron-sulfur subunit
VLIGSISAVVGILMAIPVLRYLLYPVFRVTGGVAWYSVGGTDEFAGPGPFRKEVEVRRIDGWRASTSKRTVWVVRDGRNQLAVVSDVCPHLGCGVPWREDEAIFHCPCHHAKFSGSGALIGGPSPRSLDTLPVKVENGMLLVKYEVFRNLVSYKEVIG